MDPIQDQASWLTALGQVQVAVARAGLTAALVVGVALAATTA
jgi:hypothetical protein